MKILTQINLFIRSLIFSIYMIISISVYGLMVALLFLAPLRFRHYLIRQYLGHNIWALKIICRINYEIEGVENIPQDNVGIVLCKHQSTWETFYLPVLFHDPAVIVKRELLWIPFFGWAMKVSHPIAIDRSNKQSSMQQIIDKGKKYLADKRWIIIYPEGTRTPYGEIGQYKLGGARLAAATGYPVIPVAHNAGKFWPRRGFIKKPGTVKMVIGPAIETAGRSPEEIMAQTKDWIESTVQRIKSDE